VIVFLLLSTIASVVASLVLGIRLLRLALRTRELPELMIGSSFIVAGVIGYLVMLAGNPQSGAVSPEQSATITFVGYGLIGVGVCCIYLFIWRTFHKGSWWAASLAVVGCAAVLLTTRHSIDATVAGSFGHYAGMLSRLGAGGWGAFESLRWWDRMRRRQALGLADPVVTNRFLLWGVANVTTFAIFLTTMMMPRSDAEVSMSSAMIISISLLTVLAAGVQWLAFFPTQGYLRMLRSRGSESAAA